MKGPGEAYTHSRTPYLPYASLHRSHCISIFNRKITNPHTCTHDPALCALALYNNSRGCSFLFYSTRRRVALHRGPRFGPFQTITLDCRVKSEVKLVSFSYEDRFFNERGRAAHCTFVLFQVFFSYVLCCTVLLSRKCHTGGRSTYGQNCIPAFIAFITAHNGGCLHHGA